jgi:hypothetical protein
MRTKLTKRKVTFSLSPEIIQFLEEHFENKSKYAEYLIYKDMKECGLLKNNQPDYDFRK